MLAIKTLAPKSVIFRRTVKLMGDVFEISVVGNNPGWADDRIDDAITEINRVDKLLSGFNDDGAVNVINRNAGIKPVKTDAEVFRLIDRSAQLADLTHGAFDISFSTGEKMDAAGMGYQDIELDNKAFTVFLKEKGMRIGFGANSKGYAADRAKYILQMNGVASGVINAGGDLLAWGSQPDDQPWTVATANPSQKNHPLANINISNMALATSLNVETNTPSLSNHAKTSISARKGFPVSDIKSVSILSPSAELADSMATPVMSIGINAGLYLINQLNQMGCIIVDDQERVYTSRHVSLTN